VLGGNTVIPVSESSNVPTKNNDPFRYCNVHSRRKIYVEWNFRLQLFMQKFVF